MASALNKLGVITLFVEDPKRSRTFYELAFEGRVVHEDDDSVVFGLENVLLNLLRRTQAAELVEPAGVAASDAGASVLYTIWVDDADATCQALRDKGVELLNGPLDRPWGVRTAAFADPDGYAWEIAQPLKG